MADKLNEIMESLTRISGGDMEALSRTTDEFVRNITQDVRLPAEPGSTERSGRWAAATSRKSTNRVRTNPRV